MTCFGLNNKAFLLHLSGFHHETLLLFIAFGCFIQQHCTLRRQRAMHLYSRTERAIFGSQHLDGYGRRHWHLCCHAIIWQ